MDAIACSTFGITELKAQQRETIQHICNGYTVISVLPTGFGKSLCCQIATLGLGGFTVVVSPLLALCSDQMSYLTRKGIEVARLDSSMDRDAQATVLVHLVYSGIWIYVDAKSAVKSLFTTPEILQRNNRLMLTLKQARKQNSFSYLVVDEAHCVESWSTFRCEAVVPKCRHSSACPSQNTHNMSLNNSLEEELSKKSFLVLNNCNVTGRCILHWE